VRIGAVDPRQDLLVTNQFELFGPALATHLQLYEVKVLFVRAQNEGDVTVLIDVDAVNPMSFFVELRENCELQSSFLIGYSIL
jgi:hypothetical protein